MEEITPTTTTAPPSLNRSVTSQPENSKKNANTATAPPSLNRSITSHPENSKKQRYDRCFSFMEIKIDPGIKSLKRLDSRKFKFEIQRWAKAVVRYARQVSDRFGARQASEGNSRG